MDTSESLTKLTSDVSEILTEVKHIDAGVRLIVTTGVMIIGLSALASVPPHHPSSIIGPILLVGAVCVILFS